MAKAKTFFYFNDKKYPIRVSRSACEETPHTFLPNGRLWENEAILEFYDRVPREEAATIVDIGAQSGLYSLFAKFLPMCRFYAFEPFPRSYEILLENLGLNGIKNVTARNIGISDEAGQQVLNTCRGHNGLHTMGSEPTRFSDIEPIVVPVETLDNIFSGSKEKIDFLKIDTEGWESHVLRGARNRIQRDRPVIQVEWNEENLSQCESSIHDLIRFFEELNYLEVAATDEEKLFRPL